MDFLNKEAFKEELVKTLTNDDAYSYNFTILKPEVVRDIVDEYLQGYTFLSSYLNAKNIKGYTSINASIKEAIITLIFNQY